MRALASMALMLWLAASLAHAETFQLSNGDRLSGEVVERTAERILLEHPLLGRIEVSTDQLELEEPPNPGLFGTSFLQGWTRSAEVGFSGSDGNSNNQNLRAALRLDYEDEHKRWKFSTRYLLNRADRETDDHNARAEVQRDWLRPGSRWFLWGSSRTDWDRFQSWESRVSGFGGVGHEIIQSEAFDLRGRLGAGVTKEFGDEDDDLTPEVLLGLNGFWRISDEHSLGAHTVQFPSLDDISEFRNITGVDWQIKLTEAGGLSLTFGIENEYQSDVDDPDSKQNDLKYHGGLQLDF